MIRPQLVIVAVLGCVMALANVTAAAAQTLVERAEASGQFNTLLGALQETGLVEQLEEPGPFTVFAPTDAAFAALDDAEQRLLLNPENRQLLADLLAFHVVPGRLDEEMMTGIAASAETLAGAPLAFNGTVRPINVGGAALVRAGIEADNGIIHVVDSVILPPEFNR